MQSKIFSVNPYSSEPVYEQLKSQIKKGILWGSLKPGQQLPTIKELASALSVNPNTIARAFREMIIEGFLIGEPGVGTFVNEKNKEGINDHRKNHFYQLVSTCIREGAIMGLSVEEIDYAWKQALAEFGKEGKHA